MDPEATPGLADPGPTDPLARLAARRAARLRFLHALYEAADGSPDRPVDHEEFRAGLGLGSEEFWRLRGYLAREELVCGFTTHAFCITHRGVKEVEAGLAAPAAPTEHFPPADNVILIGVAEAAVIQQGNEDSTQHVELPPAALAEARRGAAELAARVAAVELEGEELRALVAEAATAAAQLKSRRPPLAAVRETVGSVRDVLEAAVASGKAAAGVLAALGAARALLALLA